MQSVFQYRRFERAARAQLDRDRTKAPAINETGGTAGRTRLGSPTMRGDQEARDQGALERGDVPSDLNDRPRSSSALSSEKVEEPLTEADDEDDHDHDHDAGDDDPEMLAASLTLSRTTTRHSARTALGNILTGIQVRRRTTREGGEGNVFVVGFEGPHDPNDPHNWSFVKRASCTALIASIGCVVGVASAIDSSALHPAAAEFGVSEVVESLATGLFLIGFGAGALVAGPISETVGRNPVYCVTLAVYMIFIMASALAPNIGAQLTFRFLAGVFGSTPLTCAGGSISDLWTPLQRVYAFPVFANAAFTGPLLGPVMGGFIAQSNAVSWRWVEWTTLIFSGLVLALVVLFQPETYPPVLLRWKAAHMRHLTGDDRYRAEIEIRQESFAVRLGRALYRPFLLTSREPIIILVALYLTVIYVVLFGFLDGYDYIFAQIHGTSPGITGLCFLGIIVGLFGASALVPLIYVWAKRDLQKIKEAGGDRLPPEFRLWFSMLGGAFAIPISLFWMGWTSDANISLWSPLAASVLFGYGVLCVFITCYQYIIDAYELYAASALASITLIRYVASGVMVVVSIPMYENLGVHYSLTVLGCLGAALVPVPYVFFKYGSWIRAKSKYTVKTDPPGHRPTEEP